MPRMTSHYFYDLHPTVGAGGGARPLDDFRHVAKRGVEPESIVGTDQILIDRFRNANNADSRLREFCSDSERIFAATCDNCVKLEFLGVLNYFFRSIAHLSRFRQLPKRIRA